MEKSQTNATSVTMHPFMQVIWGLICTNTAEKNRTNATSVNMHPLLRVTWNSTWRSIIRQKTSRCKVNLHTWTPPPFLKQAMLSWQLSFNGDICKYISLIISIESDPIRTCLSQSRVVLISLPPSADNSTNLIFLFVFVFCIFCFIFICIKKCLT